MTSTDEEIFARVIALSAGERRDFLDKVCVETDQRRRVESLLAAHLRADSLLDTNAMHVAETISTKPQPASQQAKNPSHAHKPSSSSTISSGSGYLDTVARMMADVADALDHAHEQGVIHRDVKPSNLLLSPDGRLSINDFGLARMLEQPGMTISGEFVGSPLYMSPEQITAGRAPLDHRTDIYSLGATLYEMLTLQPPFPGDSCDQVITKIMHKDAVPPRRFNRKVPLDLETICLKALEKDPDRRYQTAGKMAEDLRHFVNRFAISARRVGIVGRASKWCRRNRAVSTLIVLFVATAGLAVWQAYYSHHESRMQTDELIQTHLSRLVDDAFSGELELANDNWSRAKELGANPEKLLLMKALIHLLDEKQEDVVTELEKVEHQLAGNTAAYAMLTVAYQHIGKETEHFKRLPFLIDLKPREYEDWLLKGYAETTWLPDDAVRDLKEAMRMKRSPGAMLL